MGRDLGEDHPASLAHHYIAYRAHVRAKVAALRAAQGDPGAGARARSLQDLSLRHLERAQVRMVLVGGAPGTGKTTVARALGDARGWEVIGSDETRKDAAGLPRAPGDPGAFEQGLYAPGVTGVVYDEIVRRASERLARGEHVVLDASWSDAGRRAAARAAARAAGARLVEIECRLEPGEAAARITRRRAAGQGASDATPEIAARLAAGSDPWPEALSLDTGPPPDLVLQEALRLAGAGGPGDLVRARGGV